MHDISPQTSGLGCWQHPKHSTAKVLALVHGLFASLSQHWTPGTDWPGALQDKFVYEPKLWCDQPTHTHDHVHSLKVDNTLTPPQKMVPFLYPLTHTGITMLSETQSKIYPIITWGVGWPSLLPITECSWSWVSLHWFYFPMTNQHCCGVSSGQGCKARKKDTSIVYHHACQ